MKKILALMALLAGAAFGQTATVLITDTIFDIQGNKPNCTIYIGNPAFVDNSGFTRVANTVQTIVNSGALSVNLVPTANAQTLGVVYTVTYACQNGPPQGSTKEFWNVPAGPGPFVLSQVRVAPIITTGGVATINGDSTHVQTITTTNTTNITLGIVNNGTGGHVITATLVGPIGVNLGGTGEAGTITGIPKANGASAFTAAVASDVVGLFTGCSGVLLLGADGACHSASGGGGLPNVYANTTYIWSQSPSGTLTGSTPATVTLTPCPVGVAGADTNHWLRVAGTGTAETVIITGGSCTSGAGSGTVQFTPANSHSAGWTLATSTNGAEEAYQVGKAAGIPFQVALIGNLTFTGPLWVDVSNVQVIGYGPAVVSCNLDAGVSFSCIKFNGTQSSLNQSTVTASLTLANRSLVTNRTITVASATGFTVGKMVSIIYDDGTLHFEQYSPIAAVAGAVITLQDPIVVPTLTTQTNGISAFNGMLANVMARDITVDCSGTSGTVGSIFGVGATLVRDSYFDNITSNNCNQSVTSGGIIALIGYNNSFHKLYSRNSGSAGNNAIEINRQSNATGSDFLSEGNTLLAQAAFGTGFVYTVNCNFSNITASGQYNRNIKLLGSGWSQFTNLIGNGSVNATGLGITIGSYRNIINNVTVLLNNSGGGNGAGIWLSGQDNEYNKVTNINAFGGVQGDIVWSATDIFNTFTAADFNLYLDGTGAALHTDCVGCNNRVEPIAYVIATAFMGCSGTFSPSTTIFLTPSQGLCTNSAPNPFTANIVVPKAGIVRNLQVHTATGGVNASSGVVTINAPLGAGSLGVTCTVGVGTTCVDGIHFFPVAAGTILNVSVTTQGAETLATMIVSFEY